VSALAVRAAEYLQVRRALGFRLRDHDWLLSGFAAFADARDADYITIELALAWATRPAGADRCWHASRLSAVRGFARHLSTADPRTQIPPAGLLKGRSRRADPYLYSAADIAAVMNAAQAIGSPLRAATYQTLTGLLAVTGMRAGEVIGLDRGDVDFGEQALTVRQGKSGKSRRLPLHPQTAAALRGYARLRDEHFPRPASPAFFVSLAGTRLIYQNIQHTFARLTRDAGLPAGPARRRPRLHDLRHTFAVTTLISWYDDGQPVQPRLPLLSTWLGHAAPDGTYWYLHAVPELLTRAAGRPGALPGGPR
jgi:integrase/recombinase XerD